MFLRRDYRDRALGVLGAFAVLASGIVLQAASAPERAEPLQGAPAIRQQTMSVGELATVSDSHCDEVC
jgi:hypothetical protein